MDESFDYIIVGAGSAGCVLARRLSDDPGTRVLLLEAGGSDRSIFIHMPSAFSIPMNQARFDWRWFTEPEPGLAGRRMHCPRGRVLGGSSSINGMAWVRGHPLDYDRWQDLGANDWSWAHMAPYFRKAERHASPDLDARRGTEGMVGICQGRRENPLYDAFVTAGEDCGYARLDDLNGPRQEGLGPMDMSVAGGLRSSSWRSYVHPVRTRANLEVRARTPVDRVLFDGPRANGVRLLDGRTVSARREVILCAGAIASPLILMRSGIGDAEALRAQGIDVRHANPAVGANLMDHLEVYVQQATSAPVSLNAHLGLLGRAAIGARWLLRRDGLGATNHFETGGFIRSAAGVQWPDLQFHFLPAAMRYDGKQPREGGGYQVHVGPMQPKSRGRVALASADPAASPGIFFNYMSEAEDREVFRRAVRLTREILSAPAFEPYRGAELSPGDSVQSDDEIDAFVAENAESAYHPCGTARMGSPETPGAVVDPELRVIGVSHLRVIDASVFPMIPNGNLNAPTITLAERAADLVRGRTPLAPEPLPFWSDPQWEQRQRSA